MGLSDIFTKPYSSNWDFFFFSVLISLLGALIGHLKANGSLQMPIVLMNFRHRFTFKNTKQDWFLLIPRSVGLAVSFIVFLVGFRVGENKESAPITVELGVLGDLLVGLGTGTLAFATMELTGSDSTLFLMSTSFLAGYAGFSYIQYLQEDKFNKRSIPSYEDKLNGTSVVEEETSSPPPEMTINEAKKQAFTTEEKEEGK
ncbi:hypothetical protein ACWE42_21220 [Sutcliffiella cohnii]